MMYKCTFWFILFTLVLLLTIRCISQSHESKEDFIDLDTGVTHKIKVKTAIDKKMGLMYRKKPLTDDTGLLFDYGRYGLFTFWMKNTFIPLEVICLDHNYKVVGVIENMIPKSKKTRSLKKPFRYAIEVNNGYSYNKNIKIGDTIEFEEINDL